MKDFVITAGTAEDGAAILSLYQAVAAIEGGLARTADEISAAYVDHFLRKSLETGVLLVARQHEQIVGEIHTYALGPKVFSHVLGELTIAVHPAAQGAGIGKALFTELLARVKQDRPNILRVELIARESNQKAIAFYRKLGFHAEGKFLSRIQSVGGGYEADIPMAWYRNPI